VPAKCRLHGSQHWPIAARRTQRFSNSNCPVGSMGDWPADSDDHRIGATSPVCLPTTHDRMFAAALGLDGPTVQVSVDASHRLIHPSFFDSLVAALSPFRLRWFLVSLSSLLFPIHHRRLPAFSTRHHHPMPHSHPLSRSSRQFHPKVIIICCADNC